MQQVALIESERFLVRAQRYVTANEERDVDRYRLKRVLKRHMATALMSFMQIESSKCPANATLLTKEQIDTEAASIVEAITRREALVRLRTGHGISPAGWLDLANSELNRAIDRRIAHLEANAPRTL